MIVSGKTIACGGRRRLRTPPPALLGRRNPWPTVTRWLVTRPRGQKKGQKKGQTDFRSEKGSERNGTAACRARSCGDGRGRGAVPASRRPAPRVAQVAAAIDCRGCAQYQTPPALAYVPTRCIRCPQAYHQSCRVLPGLPSSTIRPRATPCPTTTPRAPRRAAGSKVCAVSDDV